MTPIPPSLQPGRPQPLGATADTEGVNFAVFSRNAEAIDLCVFDAAGAQELARLPLPGRSGSVFHGRLPGAGPGLLYGYRAHGPWRPAEGHRFNPHKLLLDPYAREIAGRFQWRPEHFGHDRAEPHRIDMRDNGPFALKARVVAGADDGDDGPPAPATALADTVLYEVHLKSFTRLHPGVPAALRGTYAGFAADAAIDHLQRLGVTAVSLLPVQHRLDEQRLVERGLVNHWGYNTLGFFCVEPRYAASADPRAEFRQMVRRLHAAGIEVILDIVFNHTAESDENGPTICWRGLDNASWYRLPEHDPSLYVNDTGCGNTLDVRDPQVLQFVVDALRWWVAEMRVDGFRFDLATVLGRGDGGFDRQAAFFEAVARDPLLPGVKLIAEPWDIGPGGYQLGNFPAGWLEWNDRFRDAVRSFWLGHSATRGEFAMRLAGSADLFGRAARPPVESVNYVVSHDGFTLADLLSYERRRNEANGEGNADGHAHNFGWNGGAEGPTTDPEVLAVRGRLARALLATLLLSQGTPMLAAGDELGHTQAGNNNPYCQDNPTTWIDWSRGDADLASYVAQLVALRRELQPLAPRWYSGAATGPAGIADLGWMRPDGAALAPADWDDPTQRTLAALVGVPGRSPSPLVLLLNAGDEDLGFTLPPGGWRIRLDSARGAQGGAAPDLAQGEYLAAARSVVLLQAADRSAEAD